MLGTARRDNRRVRAILTFINSILSPDSLKEAGAKTEVTRFKSRRLRSFSGRSRETFQNSVRGSYARVPDTFIIQLIHAFSPIVRIIWCRSSHVFTHRQHVSGHNQTDKYTDGQTGDQKRKSETGQTGRCRGDMEERKKNQASNVQACGKKKSAYRGSESWNTTFMRMIKNLTTILNESPGHQWPRKANWHSESFPKFQKRPSTSRKKSTRENTGAENVKMREDRASWNSSL